MKIFKHKINTITGKRLISNFFSLSVIQIASYILPLITVPYLIHILGVEKFGLITFSQALIMYMNTFVDYGFALSATREVSIHRHNHKKLQEIFSSVMLIKFILMAISFFFLIILVIFFDRFSKEALTYFFSFGLLIGEMLFPIWLFQGMEQMKYMAILNITARLFFTLSVFIFIQNESDYPYVPMINSIGMIFVGLISLWYIRKFFLISFVVPTMKNIKYQLKEGWHLFTASLYSSFYRKSNTLILGFLTSDIHVGYYTIAEKLIKALQGLQAPLGQTLYPYLSRKFNDKSTSQSLAIIFKFTPIVVGIYLFIFSILFYFSSNIIHLFVQEPESFSYVLFNFRIMLSVFILGGLNYYYGVLGLIALNYKKDFSHAIMLTGILNIFICMVFSYLWQDMGASIALVISELFLFILLAKKFKELKKGVL